MPAKMKILSDPFIGFGDAAIPLTSISGCIIRVPLQFLFLSLDKSNIGSCAGWRCQGSLAPSTGRLRPGRVDVRIETGLLDGSFRLIEKKEPAFTGIECHQEKRQDGFAAALLGRIVPFIRGRHAHTRIAGRSSGLLVEFVRTEEHARE
jgi:hypothetical protein